MRKATLTRTLAQPFSPVKPAELRPADLEAFGGKYSRTEARHALDDQPQGVVDILETCREALGWPTITSLLLKYYPLYPHRGCWRRALARCKLQEVRTRTLNIRYLLLAVITQALQALEDAADNFSLTNRLLSISSYHLGNRSSYRLGDARGEKPANRADRTSRDWFGKYADAILSR